MMLSFKFHPPKSIHWKFVVLKWRHWKTFKIAGTVNIIWHFLFSYFGRWLKKNVTAVTQPTKDSSSLAVGLNKRSKNRCSPIICMTNHAPCSMLNQTSTCIDVWRRKKRHEALTKKKELLYKVRCYCDRGEEFVVMFLLLTSKCTVVE